MVKFTDKGHKYTHNRNKYLSVSSFIGKFKRGFDQKYWSLYKALESIVDKNTFYKYKSKYGRSFIYHLQDDLPIEAVQARVQTILDSWKQKNQTSTKRGTFFHIAKERASLENGLEKNAFDGKEYKVFDKKLKVEVNEALVDNLFDLEDGFYSELLIWNHKYKLAGQPDRVFITTIDDIRYFDLEDFKTNETIKTENTYQNMKKPVTHLQDCNWNHYRLQLSCYAWILEQFGFVPRNLSFDHFPKGVGPAIRYDIKYLKDEIESMLLFL